MREFSLDRSLIRQGDDPSTSIDYVAELNEQQLKAVTETEGPHLVIAGAGSGKTRTLVHRVAYLVECGIRPENILLLTFTRKSATEMMRRASALLNYRCLDVSGGTFHSFANSILRKYARYIGFKETFSVIDRNDSEEIINYLRAGMGLTKKERRFPKKGTILAIISKALNTLKSHKEIADVEYPQFAKDIDEIDEIARRYCTYKKEKQMMDYDDLLVYLLKLLKEHSCIRVELSNLYSHIMVDEYQDTNKIQAQIVCLLASQHGNLMVVGDDAQSIYAFRGANFRNIMDFPKIFSDCKVTTLEENYRSSQTILNLTNAIIDNASEKFTKRLFSKINSSEKPVLIKPQNLYEQADFIAQKVLEHRVKGIELKDMAILFRSSWHSNELEVQLQNSDIPYEKHGGLKFGDAAHIKDVISILRVICNPEDTVAWLRTLKMIEGVGDKTAMKIIDSINSNGKESTSLLAHPPVGKNYYEGLGRLRSVIDSIEKSPMDPVKNIQKIIDYYKPFFEERFDDFKKRKNDLDSLNAIAGRYESCEEFLSDMSLDPPETQSDINPESKDREKLILSTIHSAKGLEWKVVFIIGVNEGHLPSAQSLDSPEGVEEERRLFYVAATRAKQNLYILSPLYRKGSSSMKKQNIWKSEFLRPSRFISEIENLSSLTEQWLLTGGTASFRKDLFQASGKKQHASTHKVEDRYLDRISDYFSD